MLKGRSKAFAPKKVAPRRPQGTPVPSVSTVSSARYSVERQSETSTPAIPTRDSVPPGQEITESQITRPNPRPRDPGSYTSTVSPSKATELGPTPNELKRKTRDENTDECTAKRLFATINGDPSIHMQDAANTRNEQSTISKSTIDAISSPQTMKTNNRDGEVIQPVATWVSGDIETLTGEVGLPSTGSTIDFESDPGTTKAVQAVANNFAVEKNAIQQGLFQVEGESSTDITVVDTPHLIVGTREVILNLEPCMTMETQTSQRQAISRLHQATPTQSVAPQIVPEDTSQHSLPTSALPISSADSVSNSTQRDATKDNHKNRVQPGVISSIGGHGSFSAVSVEGTVSEDDLDGHYYPSPENIAPLCEQTSTRIGTLGLNGSSDHSIQITVNNKATRIGDTHHGAPVESASSDAAVLGISSPDGTTAPAIENSAATARAKRTYTKKLPAGENGVTANLQPKRITAKSNRRKRCTKEQKNRRKSRAETPEDAENECIDPSVITMQDLCSDLRIGKKSKNHDEIMRRAQEHRQAYIKDRMTREYPELIDLVEVQTTPGAAGPSRNTDKEITPPIAPAAGPKMRIVDGQIVTDEQSLQLDRHKRAQANANDEDVVEENDFTRIITSGDYMKRERTKYWDEPANELFWKGLRMFGTDFEMIARMFPHRSRRQIKLKFNTEERRNPKKLNRVLIGEKTEAIDLDEFQRLGNMELENLDDIKAEQARIDKEQTDQLEAVEKARREDTRRKKAAIQKGSKGARDTAGRLLANISDDESNSGVTGNQGSGKKNKSKSNKSKRNLHSSYGGGEEVVVLDSIE